MRTLKNGRAPGPDGIMAETLKEIIIYIAKPLTFLINPIYVIGKYPNHLRIAVIGPIH